MKVPRLLAEFNERTPDYGNFVLFHEGVPLNGGARTKIEFHNGQKVILYPIEEDFEVEATLNYRDEPSLSRWVWIAFPDWDTLVRK